MLVAYGSNQRTGVGRAEAGKYKMALDPQVFEHPYKPFNPPTSYALAAARHMHQYGTKREQLAEIAVAARKWAQLNPEAFAREPLTVDDVLKSRMVCDPLTVRDCCLVTDGGGAYVLVRAERAKEPAPKKPAYLLGAGCRALAPPDFLHAGPHRHGGHRVRQARLRHGAASGPQDVDVVELYDAFTINTLLFLEDLGFCKKGEGGAFVSGGRIAPGGEAAREHQRRGTVLRAPRHVRDLPARRSGATIAGRRPARAR